MPRITARQIAELINSTILFAVETQEDDSVDTKCEDELIEDKKVDRVVDFRDVGMMCGNPGLVIHISDGSEFQIQIVQSQLADDLGEDEDDDMGDDEE